MQPSRKDQNESRNLKDRRQLSPSPSQPHPIDIHSIVINATLV